MTQLAIVGGKGLSMFEGASIIKQYKPSEISTPYGEPSGVISEVNWKGGSFFCFSRHGDSQTLSPNDIPYLANAYALKKLGVRYWLAVSLSSSLKGIEAPALVVADSYTGTNQPARKDEFFNAEDTPGIVYYTDTFLTKNTSLKLALKKAANNSNQKIILNEDSENDMNPSNLIVFAGVPGPDTGTYAEQQTYTQSFNKVISGMTNMTEYKVSRQCGISYLGLSYVVGSNLNYLNPDKGIDTPSDAISHYLEAIDELIVPILSHFINQDLEHVDDNLNLSGLQGVKLTDLFGKDAKDLTSDEKRLLEISNVVLS